MPVNVRPSWIDVSVDGRDTNIATGPRSRDGSMSAKFYLRVNGSVTHVLDVDCIASRDKKTVQLQVYLYNDHGGNLIAQETFDQ
jgi:hypothetical protein